MNSTPLSNSLSLNEETVREKKAALSPVIAVSFVERDSSSTHLLYICVHIGLMSTDQGVQILQSKNKDRSD